MTVLGCLKPLTLSAVGNDDGVLRNKFVVVCKYPGVGTLLTVKCPAPGTHRETNARGGMLAAGIESHIILKMGQVLALLIESITFNVSLS